jgi:hypothetical protein
MFQIIKDLGNVTILGTSILFIIVGLTFVILRVFFFVDLKELDKKNLNIVKSNSITYILTGTLFLLVGLISFTISFNNFTHPWKTILQDLKYLSPLFGLLCLFMSLYFFIYNAKAIIGFKIIGLKVPKDTSRYTAIAIKYGVVLLCVGLLLIII